MLLLSIRAVTHIPARSMDQVVATDSHGVTITHNHDHVHIGFSHLNSGSESQCTTMGGMDGIKINVCRQPAGTADTGHHANFIFLEAETVDRSDK